MRNQLVFTLAVASAFAGCSGAASLSPAAQSLPEASAKSWMVRGAAQQSSLLYVANRSAHDVTIYTYSDGDGIQLAGTLTGFSELSGLCTDKNGDVLVVDSYARRIYRYNHGGTKRIGVIKEEGASIPNACAVDPTTGNVATTDQYNGDGKPVGLVKIYAAGYPNGKKYGVGGILPYYIAYDAKGDLFVDTQSADNHHVSLLEMTKGSTRFLRLTIAGGSLTAAGAIQWIKPTLLVGDETSGSLSAFAHRLFISGRTATIVGEVPFPNSQQASGFYRLGRRIAVPDPVSNNVTVYTFPGGVLYSVLTQSVSGPVSSVISQAGSSE
jgi:hypothetical protein